MNRYQDLAIGQVCMSGTHPYRWEQIRYDAEAYRQYTVDALHYVDHWLPDAHYPTATLDIGCGYGTMAAYLSSMDMYPVVAVDIAPLPYVPFLKLYDVAFHQLDIERDKLPFDDGYFKLVVCTELLEHLGYRPIQAMYEISRVTAKDGLMIFSTPDRDNSWWKAGGILQKAPHKLRSYRDIEALREQPVGNIDDHYYHYTLPEAKDLIKRAGFIIEVAETRQKHIYIVARRAR